MKIPLCAVCMKALKESGFAVKKAPGWSTKKQSCGHCGASAYVSGHLSSLTPQKRGEGA